MNSKGNKLILPSHLMSMQRIGGRWV